MNSYEEIKQLLEKKEFRSALLVAFSNSLKFKLTSEITNQKEHSSIETEIDLLKGLTTKVNKVDLLNDDNNLRQFHTKQLENIHKIWNQNRQILITIIKILDGNEISTLDKFETIPLNLNNSPVIEVEENNEVDEIVDLMLEENEDNHQIELDNKGENWLDETEEVSFAIDDDDDDSNLEVGEDHTSEDEDIIISAETQQQAEESWDEFMDDLSAEEEAVTEEVMVDNVSPDEEIDDNWSEWLDDDASNVSADNEDWSKEEEIIK